MYLTAEGGILGPIATVFGYLMNGIYLVLEKFGIANIGIAIIIFTLITRIILYPFTVNQQKSSKLMSIIQPEIKAIQKKYEGMQDRDSMMKQQAEIKAVYEKYGTSMSGSCVQLLIQMPIIFALYRVIMNVPAYVGVIKEHYLRVVDAIGGANAIPKLIEFFNENAKDIKGVTLKQIHNFGTDGGSYTVESCKNFIIDFLYKLNPEQLKNLISKLSLDGNAQNMVKDELAYINNANSFCGLDLSTAPSAFGIFSPYLVIPILAAISQYISSLIMQKSTETKLNQNQEQDQMQQTMKTMNLMMPLMSAVFCYGFATGIGVYWIATSVFMVIQQLIVNAQLKNLDIDELIKKNIEKANKKRAKKGLPPLNEVQMANNIKKMEETFEKKEKAREEKIKAQEQKTTNADKFYFENEDKNSLFSKANMVIKYNEKNNK